MSQQLGIRKPQAFKNLDNPALHQLENQKHSLLLTTRLSYQQESKACQ